MRKFCITVGGGFGDQLCAEPVIRYMKETWFKDDDFILMTQYPDIFSHLDVTCYDHEVKFDEPRITCNTHPDNEYFANFQMIHPVDYISILLLRRMLPLDYKQIKLQILQAKYDLVKEMFGDRSRLVLLHAGASWQSKTIPADIWQKYSDLLMENGFKVAVIGKNFSGVGKYKNESRGVVDVTGNIDLVDKLDTQELFAAVSLAPVLLSNDSAPIHVAGAFNNWIGVIATAKNPDYILPYRNGIRYKAKSLERYHIYDEFDYDPLIYMYYPNADTTEEKLRQAAPLPEDILYFCQNCFK